MNFTHPTTTATHYVSTFTNRKLTQPQLNLLVKLDEMGLRVIENAMSVYVENPQSGYSELLYPLVAALVQWVYETYNTYGRSGTMNYRGVKVAIGTFDRVKMLILSLDSKVYSNFID